MASKLSRGLTCDTITGAREVFSGEVYDPNFRRGLVFVALYPEIVVQKRHFKPLRIACGRNIELKKIQKEHGKGLFRKAFVYMSRDDNEPFGCSLTCWRPVPCYV